MIKSELVQHISTANPHLYQRDVENIVNAILDGIVAALARGDRVELRGFGAFSVKHRPARAGRNPRTGAHVPVDQKSVPFFKTGKEMRERRGDFAEHGVDDVLDVALIEMRVLRGDALDELGLDHRPRPLPVFCCHGRTLSLLRAKGAKGPTDRQD